MISKTFEEIAKSMQSAVKYSKSDASELAASIVDKVKNGEENPIKALCELEFLSQIVDLAISGVRDLAVEELSSYGDEAKQGVVKYGATFKMIETAVKYNYASTPRYLELKANEDKAAQERKQLEEQLKTIKSKTVILDETTGEMIELFPPVKSSKTTCQISLSK